MSTPITDHVRHFASAQTTDPAPAFWADFRALVRAEWRRQRLRHCPPAYLGYEGVPSWHDAWEDLVTDCYLNAILLPIAELRGCLDTGPDGVSLDALVRL